MRATIGIHLVETGDTGRSTVEAVEATVDSRHRVILLPEEETEGGAAAFNRLCKEAGTDVAVYLESGIRPGPDWLELLLKVLEEDPSHALAGPSTNRSWNEQGAFPKADDSAQNVAAVAHEAKLHYRRRKRTMEPLYSLGEFCYAVRLDAYQTIGEADEAYGAGPCWEMDYNIRAARAGFKGWWVQGAYVYRQPEGAKRWGRERLLLDINKRLYQSKFCGRQLKARGTFGNQAPVFFRNHCSGEACPNFAPWERPLARISPRQELPLVTCLMPTTASRRQYIPESIEQFLAQDYERAELLIVDDGPGRVEDLVPRNAAIRYVHLGESRRRIGAKRNEGCELARGELVAHWDDDDWYPPWRLTTQVDALAEANADICGTGTVYFLHPGRRQAFRYKYGGQEPWVYGNSMMYTKSFWSEHPFEDVAAGEDALFTSKAWPRNVLDLADPDLAPARLHSNHTSPKSTSGLYWHRIEAAAVDDTLARHRLPLVSCMMPTRGRPQCVEIAYDLFRAQDYPRLELVIVDDAASGLAEDSNPAIQRILRDPRVRYVKLDSRPTLGEKRNLGCGAARGDILLHWDDDDWYSKRRVTYQVAPILRGEADITALENQYTLEIVNCQCWTAEKRLQDAMFVGGVQGGTLAFRRSVLGPEVCYPAVNLAEDAGLLNAARAKGARFLAMPNNGVYVYVRHNANTWEFQTGRFINAQWWKPTTPPEELDGAMIERIQEASLQLRREGQQR